MSDSQHNVIERDRSSVISAIQRPGVTLDEPKQDPKAQSSTEAVNIPATKPGSVGEDELDSISAMHSQAITFYHSGRLFEAESLQRQVLESRRKLLGNGHPDLIAAMNNLAVTLEDLDRFQEAENLQREVLQHQRKTFGDNASESLWALHNLASTIESQGRLSEAESLQKEVLEKRRNILGDDTVETVAAMENLAITLRKLGRLDQAAWMSGKVLDVRKRTLGQKHSDTIRARHNHIVTLRTLGWREEIISMQHRVVEDAETVLGKTHPSYMTAMASMADTLFELGFVEEMLLVRTIILEQRQQVLGSEHHNTLWTRFNLALTLDKLGRHEESLVMKQEVLTLRKRVLGNGHPDTIGSMASLVRTLDDSNQYDQSAVLEAEILEETKRALGPDHPDTLWAMHDLATTLDKLGSDRLDETTSLRREVLDRRRRIFGDKHPDTVAAMVNLVRSFDMSQQYDRSAALETEILEARKETLARYHPDTMLAMKNLTVTLDKLNLEYQGEAVAIKSELLGLSRQIHGSSHPDTLEVIVSLANSFKTLKQYERAVVLQAEVFEERERTLGRDHFNTISAKDDLLTTLEKLNFHDDVVSIRNGRPDVQNVSLKRLQRSSTGTDTRSPQATWKRLKSAQDVRLITLRAGVDDDTLECTLSESRLDQVEKQYTALSYAWGDSKLDRVIICDGHRVNITANLHAALQRLRQPEKDLLLWCDAICIDQSNSLASLQERAEQVRRMSQIFAGAENVVVDLGDDDGTLQEAMQGINTILRIPLPLRVQSVKQHDPLSFLGLPDLSHSMWPALRLFMLRAWFKRIWCVQEVVLAHNIHIVFGHYSITMQELAEVMMVLYITHYIEARRRQTDTWNAHKWQQAFYGAFCFTGTLQLRQQWMAKKSTSLCDLVHNTLCHFSTDLRDRLYALYGMVDPHIVSDLPVSYLDSYMQLSRRFSEYLIRAGNVTWALVYSGGIGSGRPSWCIDLKMLSFRYKMDALFANVLPAGQNLIYAAGGPMAPEVRILETDNCIKIRGTVFDCIVSVTSVCPTAAAALDHIQDIIWNATTVFRFVTWIDAVVRWAATIHEEEEMGQPPPSTDPEALWRTLIHDLSQHEDDTERKPNGRVLAGYAECYEDLLAWMEMVKHDAPTLDIENLDEKEFDKRYSLPPKAVRYWLCTLGPTLGRRVAWTRNGRFAMVPQNCRVGDELAIFQGFPVPFTLRKNNNEQQYLNVGACYVHGAMDGQILEMGQDVMRDIIIR